MGGAGRKLIVMSLHQRANDRELRCVVAWRAERLREAGLPGAMAQAVAAEGSYDLHAVLELVDRGCPAQLAIRILAPLDGPVTSTEPSARPDIGRSC